MSWLGEQFSSFTEKLTEITKDVLTETGTNGAAEGSFRQSDDMSPKHLIDLCKKKDAQIQMLMNDKEALQQSIEELDSQHQETIDELLHLKTEAVNENATLRKELASQNQKLLEKSTFFQFEQNLQLAVQNTATKSLSESSISSSVKNINLVNILGILWKNFNVDAMQNFTKWLTGQIDSLESQAESIIDPLLVGRIKVYIKLLQHMTQEPEVFSPIVNEIAAVIYYFLSSNHNLCESTSNRCNNEVVVNSASCADSCDFSAQTAIPDLKHVLHLFSPNPEPFICDMVTDASTDASDSSVQTDTEAVHYCSAMFQDLQDHIVLLEDEKSDLVGQVVALSEQIEALSSINKSEISLENGVSPEVVELEDCINALERDKAELIEKMSLSSSELEHKFSVFSDETELKVSKLQTYIDSLELEKSDLQNRLSDMQRETPQSPAETQTDDSYHNIILQLSELQAHVSMLEYENSDLQEKLSGFETSSHRLIKAIQTEESMGADSQVYELQTRINMLELEISGLKAAVLELENESNGSSSCISPNHEASNADELKGKISDLKQRQNLSEKNTSSALIQTDKYDCGCNVYEMEAMMCIVEQEKADLEEELSMYRNRSCTSTEVQTDETCLAISILNKENADLKEALSVYRSRSCTSSEIQTVEIASDISLLIQEKADLEKELSVYRNRSFRSTGIQTDETYSGKSILEHERLELRCKLAEREKIYRDSEREMMDEISLLREEVNCSESFIDEKENIINSLTFELQEYKNRIRQFSENRPSPRSTLSAITQTIENLHSYEAYQSEMRELKKSIEEKEMAFSVMQNDLNVAVDELKKELESKIKIISENEYVVQFLKREVDAYEKYIKELTEKSSQSRSLEVQTDEIKCSCEKYKSQISELNKYIKAREMELKAAETQLSDIVRNLKGEIEGKDELISKKSTEIHSLQNQVEKQEEFLANSKSELRMYIEKKEMELRAAETQLTDRVHNLNGELEEKDVLISKKDAEILSLRNKVKEQAEFLASAKSQQEKSIAFKECQTDANQNAYETEIMKLKLIITEKESALEQNMSLGSINDLKEALHAKCSLINEKDDIIRNINADLEKYRTDIGSLTKELISFKSGSCEESCPCKKYESELADLKMFISEKDKIFKATQTNLVSSVDSLKEAIKDKEGIIKDRDFALSTLKEELEEAKRNMKIHFNEIAFSSKLDYSNNIDTVEESAIKMLTQTCNRCKSRVNGESNDNDFKNEVQSLQEKLRALDLDKNQLLCVLNEKSQECSSLKAEVHKLTNIVASEKQALFKLQQDNCMLRESTDTSDPELTKEAVKKLSQIIRDKDLEIESLKQKNLTLTTLIQEGSSSPDHLQSIMEEKENLEKQVSVLKADRDKIMLNYNAVNKDCQQYATEINKLKTALSAEKEKFDVLEQKHFSVAQQYEEKQKSLINTQNEMIALKQRVTDLEDQQVDIKEKYSELLNRINSEKEDLVQLSKSEIGEKDSLIEELKSSNLKKDHLIQEKDHLIQEKDCLILELSQQVKTLKSDHEHQVATVSTLQSRVEEHSGKVKELEDTVQQLQNEKEALDLRFQDKSSEVGLLKEMNDRLNMSLKEKEFTIHSMTEKVSSLSQFISSDHSTSDTVDINQILADSESMFARAQLLYKERDETLLALSQCKQENQSLRNEIQRMKSSEIHLNKELDRLRMHLIEIEENYTQEAIKAEERERELKDEIVELKHRAEVSNTAVVDTSQRASLQLASLQEQLSMIANQRDQALAQVSILEDKVQKQSTSVSKLQLVLEQIQRGNDKKVKETEKKLTALIGKEKQHYKELEKKLQEKEMQLQESSQALEAASRLSEQLDAKEEVIVCLKSELSKTESKIKSTTQEIDNIKSNTEGKVDRVVMKSLVLGYFSTPPDKKSEVIRLLARVLDFNQEEMEKAGIMVGRSVPRSSQGGILSSIFGRLPSISSERIQTGPEQSFTTLFVQFLENESQPFVPMKFPAEKMSPDLPSSSKKSPTDKKKLSLASPLLLDIDTAFPTFSPVPSVEYSQNSSALREVLK